MSVLAASDTILSVLVEDARTRSTDYLRATYLQGRDLSGGDPRLVPWMDVMDAVQVVLRERIAADWLHAGWCPIICCPSPDEHLAAVADGAREIAAAFVSGASLAPVVCRVTWPHDSASTDTVADLVRSQAFNRLIADLVAVGPSEVTA